MKIGDTGSAVRAWQESLVARGYALAIDGDFGKRTHNATLAFQTAEGLLDLFDDDGKHRCEPGVVGPIELQVIAAPPRTSIPPSPLLPHTVPLIHARHFQRQVDDNGVSRPVVRASVDLIVLHSMECPEASTRAESCALWMAGPSAPMASVHYFVDSDSVVQGVDDHYIAWHAPGANHHGIGIEHAGYARQSREEWLDAFGHRMLGLSVQLTARLCQQWKIPATFVRAAELQLRKRGITTHREVSVAFRRSTHTDPGPGFPIAWYVERVAALLTAQRGRV